MRSDTHEYGVPKENKELSAKYQKQMTLPAQQFLLSHDDEGPLDTVEKLGKKLKSMYDGVKEGDGKVCSIHMFGIKYGNDIISRGFTSGKIIKAAGIDKSYYTELKKAINIYKALTSNAYGISLSSSTTRRNNGPRLSGGENILFYGVPGAGKSYAVNEIVKDSELKERVVFHPDYSYSDFVGQILPSVEQTDTGDDKLRYKFIPGPFTRILKLAYDHPDSMCYLVIEEINRGNAPAIFGEVFQLLDRDGSGRSEYGIVNPEIARVVYESEKEENEKESVVIPSNLTILATMNTSDQNVFSLDTAFQRRWKMKLVYNDIDRAVHSDKIIKGSKIRWGAFAHVVNDAVVESCRDLISSEDKRLGAYFVKEEDLSPDQFPEKVLKYLWDDAFRMKREDFFSPEMKTLEQVIKVYSEAEGDKLEAVLHKDIYQRMIKHPANHNRGDLTEDPEKNFSVDSVGDKDNSDGSPDGNVLTGQENSAE